MNLNNNDLRKLPDDTDQMANLTTLFLANNFLTELPTSIQNLQNLKKNDFTGNLFRCDCDTHWMTDWLVSFFSKVENPYSFACFAGKGQGKHLINLNQDDVGCLSAHQLPPSPVLKYSFIGVSSAVVLGIILANVTYKYRGCIKIWLYTRLDFHPWDKVKENLQE